MKYCSHCGAEVSHRIPPGDNRERFVCDRCDTIFYQNPNLVAGTLAVYQQQILLCRRAIEPRLGYWTLPAGFMENGESTSAAACRETREEANAEVTVQQLLSLISVPHIDQVHLFYLARLEQPQFSSGEESLEVALFSEADIPWQEIAFPTVSRTLKHYFRHQHTTPQLPCLTDTIELTDSLKRLEQQENIKQHQKSASRQTS
ncbi:NUDIX hydrolase [Bacterioplanoides pacificum]|uniref:NUDIX hydrolase n=1 Tax=Bacterioplanoides pacificum TaxID=1171596 RepID=A0ABV7VT27_9GAMM